MPKEPSAEQRINEAKAFIQKKDIKRAYNCLCDAIKINPHNADAYYMRGTILSKSRKYKNALADLSQAITLSDFSHSRAFRVRAKIYEELGEVEKSKEDQVLAIAARGFEFHENGELTNAYAAYEKAIKLNPNSPDAYFMRTNTYLNENKVEEAFQDVSKFIALTREQGHPYLFMATTLQIKLGLHLNKSDEQLNTSKFILLGFLDATKGQNTPERQNMQQILNKLQRRSEHEQTHLTPQKMPQVETSLSKEQLKMTFHDARKTACEGMQGQRVIALITPGRLLMAVPGVSAGNLPDSQVAPARKILNPPNNQALDVVVIGNTDVEQLALQKVNPIMALNNMIPFFGYVMAWHSIGNNVIVFEGHDDALEFACKDADALVVDKAMMPFLPDNWLVRAKQVMRRPYIVLMGRDYSIDIVSN